MTCFLLPPRAFFHFRYCHDTCTKDRSCSAFDFLTRTKKKNACDDQRQAVRRLAGRPPECPCVAKSLTVAIFSNVINMIKLRLCMMVVHIELYPLIRFLVTLIVFQGHSNVKQFQLKILFLTDSLKLCTIVDFVQ